MKAVRLAIGGLAAIAVALVLAPGAFAFHTGGVAECAGCHSMHNPSSNKGSS